MHLLEVVNQVIDQGHKKTGQLPGLVGLHSFNRVREITGRVVRLCRQQIDVPGDVLPGAHGTGQASRVHLEALSRRLRARGVRNRPEQFAG